MTDKTNPLMALFSDKAPTDAEILEQVGEKVEEKPVVDDELEDEDDEGGEAKEEKDEEEDDDKVPDTVPKAVLLAERRKHREKMAKLTGREEALKEVATARPTEKQDKEVEEEFVEPDPSTDPKGYREFMEARVQTTIINERMNNSERWAVKEHGKETVDKAFAWYAGQVKTNPNLGKHVTNHPDPYEETVRLYNADQRANELKGVDTKELDNFRKWSKAKKEGKLAEWEAEQAAAAKGAKPEAGAKPAKKANKPVREVEDEDDDETPPRSLASEQAARGGDAKEVSVGAGKAFNSLFE